MIKRIEHPLDSDVPCTKARKRRERASRRQEETVRRGVEQLAPVEESADKVAGRTERTPVDAEFLRDVSIDFGNPHAQIDLNRMIQCEPVDQHFLVAQVRRERLHDRIGVRRARHAAGNHHRAGCAAERQVQLREARIEHALHRLRIDADRNRFAQDRPIVRAQRKERRRSRFLAEYEYGLRCRHMHVGDVRVRNEYCDSRLRQFHHLAFTRRYDQRRIRVGRVCAVHACEGAREGYTREDCQCKSTRKSTPRTTG